MRNTITTILLFVSAFLAALPAVAATPSPAMLEQFKQLPRAQQERLAKQYGMDINQLTQLSRQSPGQLGDSDLLQQLTPKQRQASEQALQLKEVAEKPKGPQRFGLNLFDAEISTFAPTAAIPVPDNYRLGPDDTLQLQLYGKTNQQYDVVVSRDGNIHIPELGSINVAGLTFSEVKPLLQSRISQSLLGVEAAVSMGKLRTINVFVAGEAKYPGSYTVSALATVTQALFIAGGVSEIGSLRHITVQRSGQHVATFDLYDLLLRGDARKDVHLQNGDVLFIEPVRAIAEVRGEVRRPALFEVTDKDTLSSLLAMAGGLKEGGYPQSSVLERFNEHNVRKLQNIDLTDSKNHSLNVRSGDVLRIGVASPRIGNRITVAGAVVRPGFFAWYSGIKVNDLLSSIWSDLHLTVDLDYALVLREINPQGDIEVLQFNLGKAISEPTSGHNLELQAGDSLLVFHYGNQSYNRTALNQVLRDELKTRFELPDLERWLSSEQLADQAFKQIFAEDDKRIASMIADQRISDNVSIISRNEKELSDIPEPFSYEATLQEQQQNVQEVMLRYLNNLLYDAELLPFSAHFTRRELLYPVLERLKRQARNGNWPQLVSISGEVLVDGEYPLTRQASTADLIAAAGGLKDSAHIGRAELTRLAANNSGSAGLNVEHITVDLQQVLSGKQNISLHSRDRLNVFATPDWNIERVVEVRGEVKFPGRYLVQKGESLSDVIQRAGGVSSGAFVNGAIFTRTQVKEREILQVRKLIEQLRADVASRTLAAERSLISPQDAVAMIKELEKQTPVGRLVVDLPGILTGDPQADLVLEHGDMLYVPRQNTAITVVGEVQHASSHRFRADMSLQNYLEQAGGFRKRADKERVYVIRADGSVIIPKTDRWFSVSNQQLKPGDTIVVPLDTEYKDNLSLWAQVTQIFYQSAVALAALNSF